MLKLKALSSDDDDKQQKVALCSPWSELLPDLLKFISQKLDLTDYIRFRSVCKPWRFAAKPSLLRPQPPFLMVEQVPHDENTSFFSLSARRTFKVFLPELRGKRVLNSSHGWLVILDVGDSKTLSLLNPINGSQIDLPPTTSFAHSDDASDWWTPSLSSNPALSAGGDCMVMILRCYEKKSRAAFCRVGDPSWATLETCLPHKPFHISYHQGRFYAFDRRGNFSIYNAAASSGLLGNSILMLGEDCPFLGILEEGELYYVGLFEMEDDEGMNHEGIQHSRVLKAEPSDSLVWSEVTSLEGKALFLSQSQLLILSVKDFEWCDEDCIYSTLSLCYTYEPRMPDVFVADLNNNLREVISCSHDDSRFKWTEFLWITPSLC